MIYFTTVVDQYHHIFEAKVSVLYQKCSKLCICGLRHSQQGWISKHLSVLLSRSLLILL